MTNRGNLVLSFGIAGPEQIHVKPVAEDLCHLARARNEVTVIYVPPFSGIGVNETRYDRPYQDMLVGQGKGGDILRNLLLEVAEKNGGADWDQVQKIVEDVFGYRLIRPVYAGAPYITCQYLKGIPKGQWVWRIAAAGCFHNGKRISSGASDPCFHVCPAIKPDPAG